MDLAAQRLFTKGIRLWSRKTHVRPVMILCGHIGKDAINTVPIRVKVIVAQLKLCDQKDDQAGSDAILRPKTFIIA